MRSHCSYYILLKQIITFHSLLDLISSSQLLTLGQRTDNVQMDGNFNNESFAITFPGTKWCGPGNTASSYDDLGKYEETDKCCRDHDNCENIPAGEEKYGLRNDDWFTRLHCRCDKEFYQCLHAAKETASDVIGRQYFLARDKCFKEEYPIIGCIKYQNNILIRRCISYSFDNTMPKKYQWFDLPLYDIDMYPENRDLIDDEQYYKIQLQRQHEFLISQNEIENERLAEGLDYE